MELKHVKCRFNRQTHALVVGLDFPEAFGT